MIRPLRLYDVPALSRLLEEPLAGDLGAVASSTRLSPMNLVGLALTGRLGTPHGPRCMFVDTERLRLRGFVHLARLRGATRWEITHLCHDGAGDTVEECTGMLEFGCSWVASEGATKVTARVREVDDRLALFHEVGFRKYARETVLVLAGGIDVANAEPAPPTRPFVEGDQWALHRLYTATTPHGVQFVENLTSREHQFPTGGSLSGFIGGLKVSSELLHQGPELGAAVAFVVHRRRRVAELHLSMAAAAATDVERLLRRRLHQLHSRGIDIVVTTVRHYELDTLQIVRRLGFEPVYARSIVVKHMATPIHAPRVARILEKAPSLPVVTSARPAMRSSARRRLSEGVGAGVSD